MTDTDRTDGTGAAQTDAALHAVLDGFVAVCGAPDDRAVTTAADDALARLDALLARTRDDRG